MGNEDLDGRKALLNYEGQTFDVPVEIAEDIEDVIAAIDAFHGGHWFHLNGDNGSARLWLHGASAVFTQYPTGYKTPDDRKSYVETWLETAARARLGLITTE